MPTHGSDNSPILRLERLTKSVSGGRTLFANLDLSVRAGELVAVTGESGVGKSTLLNLIAGLDRSDSGETWVDGLALSVLDDDARTNLRRDRIGFVFQAFHILPHLTLARNVALPLALQGVPAKAALARANEMLEAVDLGGRGDEPPSNLSGGELQRVAIARALAHRPALILADEPTGNLDPETAARVLDIFLCQVRQAGAAAVVVTHSESVAAAADRRLTLTAEGLHGRHAP